MAKKKTAKRKTAKKTKKKSHAKDSDRRWSANVKTVATFPPKDLYTKDAETIARVMATKKVSPKGLGSAIRMVTFYINRAGRDLPAARRRELEKAKAILQEKNAKRKAKT